MKLTLNGFVQDWNNSHDRFTFLVLETPVINKPVSVEIRYPAVEYRRFYSTEKWNELNGFVDTLSRGTMFVVSNEYLFRRGIIEIKIASQNHNYRENHVICVLKWIGEELFPQGS